MIKCIICGSEVPPHKPERKQRQTCSEICRYKLIARNRPPAKGGWAKPKIKHICQNCGQVFYPRNPDSERNPNKFCSRRCFHEFARVNTPRGEKSWAWKGGRTTREGYILVYTPQHPCADKSGYVAEHRLIMEEHLGRLLKKGERVHHTGDRSDNRLQKLQLLSSHYHLKCPFCGRKFNPPQGTFI